MVATDTWFQGSGVIAIAVSNSFSQINHRIKSVMLETFKNMLAKY